MNEIESAEEIDWHATGRLPTSSGGPEVPSMNRRGRSEFWSFDKVPRGDSAGHLKKWASTVPSVSMLASAAVQAFWKWFCENANEFGETFENDEPLMELDRRVEELGDFAWQIGPGREKPNSFVLSPGGERSLLEETTAIVAAAPSLPDWEFHSAKPARPWKTKFEMRVDGLEREVDASTWRVLLRYPDGACDVVVEAPNLAELAEKYQRWAVEIAIDGLIGERRRLENVRNILVVARFSVQENDAGFSIGELASRVGGWRD